MKKSVEIVIGLVVAAAIGGIAYYFYKRQSTPKPVIFPPAAGGSGTGASAGAGSGGAANGGTSGGSGGGSSSGSSGAGGSANGSSSGNASASAGNYHVDPHAGCTACPDGWSLVQPAPGYYQCKAPSSYSGKCNTTSRFMGYTGQQALAWAKECGAPWSNPCPTIACQTCPDGWTPTGLDWTGLTTCKAPSSYSGPCNKTSKFAGYSKDAAATWAKNCKASWSEPCNMAYKPSS